MVAAILLLIFGVFCCSPAVIFIKASALHPVLLAAYRLLVAALVLIPVFLAAARRHKNSWSPALLRRSLLPAIVLGLHFVSWIVGARLTTAANATLIVNLVPLAMPLFAIPLVGEWPSANELLGTFLALGGMALLGIVDFQLSAEYFRGDLLCFVSMLLFTAYLALGRRNKDFASTWLYVVPLYLTGGLFCLLCSLLFVNPIRKYGHREILLVLALGIVPTVLGHSILNWSLARLRSQLVSLVNMGQFIFAGILAFLLFHEVPDVSFYVAGMLVSGGATLALLRRKHSPRM
ncbi:MAG: DMT family transporter [Kiritimatiellae bacterium]|nr:DMT family transporter [Kiritimatiellia bacterium]